MLKSAIAATPLMAIGLMAFNTSFADCELTPYEKYKMAEYQAQEISNAREDHKARREERRYHWTHDYDR